MPNLPAVAATEHLTHQSSLGAGSSSTVQWCKQDPRCQDWRENGIFECLLPLQTGTPRLRDTTELDGVQKNGSGAWYTHWPLLRRVAQCQ
jgi:hypothetical protein